MTVQMCRVQNKLINNNNRTKYNPSLSDSEVYGWVLNQWRKEVLGGAAGGGV